MGYILDAGAQITCSHGGTASGTAVDPRVMINGQPIMVQKPGPHYAVAGCAFPPPPAGNGPCLTAMFTMAAMRVKASNFAVLTSDGISAAMCVPTSTPLMQVMTQTQVQAL